jgi:DNA invertase Pin-like site-specific DNA recombinase
MGILGIYVRTSIDKDNTSIEQQKRMGKTFCQKNKFEYQIYEDVGKSGFKIEDEENPFKTRPGLIKLIEDIEKKIVDKIWVFEHSRLSRNQYASFILNRTFEKHSITIYENDKKFDMNNPQNQMIQGILTQISQYERHLITTRSTRGVRDTINRGIRGFNELYGYKKGGIKDDGYMRWIPVKPEIENIRYAFQEYLKGKPVNQIVIELFKKKINEKNRSGYVKKWGRLLRQFAYTGYSLNTDGLELYNKYMKFEIDGIKELKDKKYYVKSLSYPEKIVSIENWIKVVEKLHSNKEVYKNKMRRSDTEAMTGIIQCPYCELRYYYALDKNIAYYRHHAKKLCGQRPKSFSVESMNSLIEVFYFYFYLVYDDTKTLIEESQKILKLNLLEIKERIKEIETENSRQQKQIERFQSIYEETKDTDLLKLTLIKEKELISKIETNNEGIKKYKVELEELNRKYDQDEMELTYYNVKDTVIDFIEKMTNEEKRTSLIKVIKTCQVFGKYLVIDTGKLLFIFNTDNDYFLPDDVYDKFKKDKRFKQNFLNSGSLTDDDTGFFSREVLELLKMPEKKMKNITKRQEEIISSVVDRAMVRALGENHIEEYSMSKKYNYREVKIDMEKKLETIGIKYNLSRIDKIISFTKL